MKKLLVLLLAMFILFTFIACDGDANVVSTGESSNTLTSDTENTSNTIENSSTNDITTSSENVTSPSPSHTHHYISKDIVVRTCVTDGKTTFTCSCGHSYTANIPAKGHEWSKKWTLSVKPTYTTEAVRTRTCANCSAIDKKVASKLDINNLFQNYPRIVTTDNISSIGFFDSVDDLDVNTVLHWVVTKVKYFKKLSPNTHTYLISSLNDYTSKYLGCTFDYSLAVKDNKNEKVVYDAVAQTITYTNTMEYFSFYADYEGYKQIDETHFTVTYKTNYGYKANTAILEIENIGDNYIITAHKELIK